MDTLQMINTTADDTTQALIAGIADEYFAIPLSSIITIENVPVSEIKMVDHEDVIYLRGNIISLVYLDKFFRIENSNEKKDNVTVVVCDFEGQSFGFVVDTLLGQRDITAKSMGVLDENDFFNGASILDEEDNVALILNIPSFV